MIPSPDLFIGYGNPMNTLDKTASCKRRAGATHTRRVS